MRVAIIPARGGSKRIPKKNIKSFNGKPIIAYSIDVALQAGTFEKVIVSTDSQEIADVALEHGADVPFLRPAELSGDHVATAPVIQHAVQWLLEDGFSVEYACCIYATAPFLMADDLAKGQNLIADGHATTVFSVTSYPFPIQRSLRLDDKQTVSMNWPEHRTTRSQDLEEIYHDAGQFYWINWSKFEKDLNLYAEDSRAVVLPRNRVQDIDTPEDWELAKMMHAHLNNTASLHNA